MPKDRYSKQGAQLTPLQYLLSSRLAIGMGMFLSKHMPPSIGYAVGGIAAGLLNRLKPDAYWIAHNNVRQVVGPQVNEQSLRKMVDQTFRNAARNYYDLWRLVSPDFRKKVDGRAYCLRPLTHQTPEIVV
ncbi:MAG: hypothetical protein SXV54_14325, partial [Chloroflexota bacterium]|nr:hypothetical protein [Chloroflexota bacterium]